MDPAAALTNYRDRFDREEAVLTLRAEDTTKTGRLLDALKGHVYRHRGIKTVDQDAGGRRVVRLCPTACPTTTAASSSGSHLPAALLTTLTNAGFIVMPEPTPAAAGAPPESKSATPGATAAIVVYESRSSVHLTADNFTMVEILTEVLPSGMTIPSGFEQIGHIAHVNLHAEQLPWKYVIGKVLLDTNYPMIETVVNKTASLSSEFRELPMELIAGVPKYEASIRQGGCDFWVPFDAVYWNSKLCEEHDRLVRRWFQGTATTSSGGSVSANGGKGKNNTNAATPGGVAAAPPARSVAPVRDDIMDVMAGIGPFTIPAFFIQRCRHVFSNDLNPAAVTAMEKNFRANLRLLGGDAKRVVCSAGGADGVDPSVVAAGGSNGATFSAIMTVPGGAAATVAAAVTTSTAASNVSTFQTFNLDGRAFIEKMRKEKLSHGPPQGTVVDAVTGRYVSGPRRHFVMNLPALAIQFLDAFRGPQWIDTPANTMKHDRTFLVHCYGFSAHMDLDAAKADAIQQVEAVLGTSIASVMEDVIVVRDVAPKKVMVCVSFGLPEAVFAGQCAPLVPAGGKTAARRERSPPEAHEGAAAVAAEGHHDEGEPTKRKRV